MEWHSPVALLKGVGEQRERKLQKMGISTAGLNHKLHNRRPTNLREAACMAKWLRMNGKELRTHFFIT